MQLFEIRADTGVVNRKIRMGSKGVWNQAVDMIVTYKGIYILGWIGSSFCVEGTCQSISD